MFTSIIYMNLSGNRLLRHTKIWYDFGVTGSYLYSGAYCETNQYSIYNIKFRDSIIVLYKSLFLVL